MLIALNDRLFLAINASATSDPFTVILAGLAASWLVYAAAVLIPALWIWGRQEKRGALLATVLGTGIALGANQVLGLLWYEPRPFMIGLGHTLAFHVVENSFPSDHGTFMWSLGFGLIATGAARRWGALACLAGLLVAWARIYLGLHFPIDMAASLLVAIAGAALARAVLPASERWLHPVAHGLYEGTLRSLRLPHALFPRGLDR
jgi:undecaprenyl-diphosphatase